MNKKFVLLPFFLFYLSVNAQTNSSSCLTDYQLIKLQQSITSDITGFLNHQGWSFQEAKSNSTFRFKEGDIAYDELKFSKSGSSRANLVVYNSINKSNVIVFETTETCFQALLNSYTLKAKPTSSIVNNRFVNTFIQNGITIEFQQFKSDEGTVNYDVLLFNVKDLENYAKAEKSKKTISENDKSENADQRLNPVNNNEPDNIPKEDDDKVYTKVEIDAEFPGGNVAWTKYITRAITANTDELHQDQSNSGTCVVKFIVDKSGKVSDVQATTMKGTKLAEIAVNAILKGPNWTPAVQNGRQVNAYRLQPVTFTFPDQ